MKNVFLKLILLILPGILLNYQETYAQNGKSDISQWVKDNFAKNKIPPFSFVYGGKSSDTFIKNWQYNAEEKTSTNKDVEESVYTYSDPQTGLAVKCFVTCFHDFQAAEWLLRFFNTSGENTPLLERAAVIDHSFMSDVKGPFVLYHLRGSTADRVDFHPYKDVLAMGKSIYLTPVGGRSSDGELGFPFFNIEMPDQQGIMVAIGWTGKWYADVQQKDERSVALVSGMERMQLSLFPGEEIRTPKICLLFWKGEDRMTGHNQFRRFVLAHHTHTIDGGKLLSPFASDIILAGPGPFPCNIYTCQTELYSLAAIDRFRQFGLVPEVFWLDAGWYPLPEGCNGRWSNVGNWEVNKKNFPNGLKPISDAAHAVGAKFLVWFEPERLSEGTEIYLEHPEWVMEIPNVMANKKLLNLGNKEARLWLTDRISDIIRQEGIDIYRQDFNFDPYPYWEKADQPQRRGISEIRHIEGLYAFWDSLLVRFPDLLIDNCAAGGRRLDLETISRSSSLTRTDYPGWEVPNGSQDQTYGLNFYLPIHGTSNVTRSPYHFRSNLSSAIVLSGNINSGENSVEDLQTYVQDFKRLRPYYYGDYYPLTDLPGFQADHSWLAYQLNRPEEGDGIILAFRRDNCFSKTLKINIKGLDKNKIYEVFYEDYKMKVDKTGGELMGGLDIYIPERPGSLLISYRKIE